MSIPPLPLAGPTRAPRATGAGATPSAADPAAFERFMGRHLDTARSDDTAAADPARGSTDPAGPAAVTRAPRPSALASRTSRARGDGTGPGSPSQDHGGVDASRRKPAPSTTDPSPTAPGVDGVADGSTAGVSAGVAGGEIAGATGAATGAVTGGATGGATADATGDATGGAAGAGAGPVSRAGGTHRGQAGHSTGGQVVSGVANKAAGAAGPGADSSRRAAPGSDVAGSDGLGGSDSRSAGGAVSGPTAGSTAGAVMGPAAGSALEPAEGVLETVTGTEATPEPGADRTSLGAAGARDGSAGNDDGTGDLVTGPDLDLRTDGSTRSTGSTGSTRSTDSTVAEGAGTADGTGSADATGPADGTGPGNGPGNGAGNGPGNGPGGGVGSPGSPQVPGTGALTAVSVGQAGPHSTATAGAARAAAILDQVLPAVPRVVQRGDGTSRLTLKLHPADLGEVHLTVSVRNQSVDVTVTAGAEARAALGEGSARLRSLLEGIGHTTGQVTFRDPNGAAVGNPGASGQGAGHSGTHWGQSGSQSGSQSGGQSGSQSGQPQLNGDATGGSAERSPGQRGQSPAEPRPTGAARSVHPLHPGEDPRLRPRAASGLDVTI